MSPTAGGLTSAEAARRLREGGPNLPSAAPRARLPGRVGQQLRDPMIALLQVAAVLSAVLHDWGSTAIIAAVVVFNTTIGVMQQYRADRVMAELARLAAPTSLVRRDGTLTRVPAAGLVAGDEVVLAGGDVVPADGVVLEAHGLEVDESPVTGESLPVGRDAGQEVLGATRVTRGRAVVTLTRTGDASTLGRIAGLLAGAGNRPTPLQRRLTRLSRGLVLLVVSLTAVVVAMGVVQGRPWGEMLLVGLSLTVAAVPESLPAVVTIALAIGAHRMAQRHVVVRSLPAVETLGSVTVVATDKTGTITEARMVAQALWVEGETYDVSGPVDGPGDGPGGGAGDGSGCGRRGVGLLLRDLALCNDADLVVDDSGRRVVTGDPFEAALLALADGGDGDARATRTSWPRTGESPFEHGSRTMTTRHRDHAGKALWVRKGAPEAVLRQVRDGGSDLARATRAADGLAASGLRVIAVLDCADGETWRLAGLVGVGDPPRASAAAVVRTLRRAGIRLVLVTGDHAGTALAVARQVGIADADARPVEGEHLDAVAPERRRHLTVVARVLPDQKVGVVRWLQDAGEVVAMLGDGVNDAPALRRADIGVAAGRRGSEVAKEAADLVLTDDELGSVVAAVEEGRRIFANIRSFLLYAVSGGLAEVGVMVTGGLVGLAVPLLPGQILWINLLTHGLVGVAFGSEPLDPREMARAPRPPGEPVFTRPALRRLVATTVALVACVLVAAALTDPAEEVRRTAVFLTLGAGQLGVALALRSPRRGVTWRGHGLELAVVVAVLLLVAAVWLPPLQALLGTTGLAWGTVATAAAAACVPAMVLRLWLRWSAGAVPPVGRRPQSRPSSPEGDE